MGQLNGQGSGSRRCRKISLIQCFQSPCPTMDWGAQWSDDTSFLLLGDKSIHSPACPVCGIWQGGENGYYCGGFLQTSDSFLFHRNRYRRFLSIQGPQPRGCSGRCFYQIAHWTHCTHWFRSGWINRCGDDWSYFIKSWFHDEFSRNNHDFWFV